jgi:hypothetical protein
MNGKQQPYPSQTSSHDTLYLRNEFKGFWKKTGRGELLVGGAEFVGLVLLLALPQDVSGWHKEWDEEAIVHLKRAWTSAPVMDEDKWVFNYIGHPVAGALYYNALRSQNATWAQSMLFAAGQSFVWEYIIEAVAEQPSIQDLIVTPLLGTVLGEPIHRATLAIRRNGYSFLEKVVVFVINPMFVLNNGYRTPDKMKRKE